MRLLFIVRRIVGGRGPGERDRGQVRGWLARAGEFHFARVY